MAGLVISQGFYDTLKRIESAGRQYAQNPKSSASGFYQFTRGTWEGLGYNWNDRFNANLQEEAIRKLTTQNASSLINAGIYVGNSSLYAAHFLGAPTAINVLGANNNEKISNLVSPGVISANPFLSGMSVGAFKQWLTSKTGGGAPTSIAGAVNSLGHSIENPGVGGYGLSNIFDGLGMGLDMLKGANPLASIFSGIGGNLIEKFLPGIAGDVAETGLGFLFGGPIGGLLAGGENVIEGLLGGGDKEPSMVDKILAWLKNFFSVENAVRATAVVVGAILITGVVFYYLRQPIAKIMTTVADVRTGGKASQAMKAMT